MAKRFSRLTTRRHHAAHPDSYFVEELQSSILGLGKQQLKALVLTFRQKHSCKESSSAASTPDTSHMSE
eukprot:4432724-Prorocentrum_lima.AAC.1